MLQACQPTYMLCHCKHASQWSYNICVLQACWLISRPYFILSHYPTLTPCISPQPQPGGTCPTHPPQLFPHGCLSPQWCSEGYYCDNHLSINPTTTKYFFHTLQCRPDFMVVVESLQVCVSVIGRETTASPSSLCHSPCSPPSLARAVWPV